MINKEQIQNEYQKLYPEILKSIQEVCSFPSILDLTTKTKDKPFGKSIDDCLNYALELCKYLGFKTYKDTKGFYGFAEFGEGEELLGILCHLDVVPVNDPDKWYADPFTVLEQDGLLIARGVSDDKGPTIVNIFAVKALMNLGVKFNKRVRLIFGTDEENLWQCMHEYKKREEIPNRGFTPDGNFPLIFAEKGLLQFTLEGVGSKNFTIKNEGAWNVVPASVKFEGVLNESLKNLDIKCEVGESTLTVFGVASHAQSTEKGDNAIIKLSKVLIENGIEHPILRFVNEKCDSPFGVSMFGEICDEESGPLKTNLAMIDVNTEKSVLSFDFRIPVTYDVDKLILELETIAHDHNLKFSIYDKIDSLYVDKNSDLVQNLCSIYAEESSFDSTPIAMGGATYSRMFKNFVTYGMTFPDSEKTAHMANESLKISDIEKAFTIYSRAINYLLNS